MNKRNITIIIVILLIWNVVLTVLFVNKNKSTTTVTEENVYGISTDLTKVVKDSYSSVVRVKSSFGNQTGFIYMQNNNTAYIVTTYHGIQKDNTITVTFANGKSIAATSIGNDKLLDLAVLSIDVPYVLNPVKCGDNEYTNKGEFVICIGSGSDTKKSNDIKLGIVSNNLLNIDDKVTIDKQSLKTQKEMLALSLDVGEGYSGSPIFNMKDEVIGMVQMGDDEEIYSLTINELKIVADKIINNNKYNKLDLGIKGRYIKDLENYEKNMLNIPFESINGYYVEDVLPNSLSSKLGIQLGDIIISINNTQINSQKDLLNFLYSNTSEDIAIIINRTDNQLELKGSIND